MVTGVLSYTGKYITKRLLAMNERVRTLTSHPDRENPFGQEIEFFPYNFDKPQKLRESLEGIETLFNTYWIRTPYANMTFEKAVANTKILVEAAQMAGVKKIVHISVTNANVKSELPYFRGKGEVERIIQESGLNYVILQPALIFGREDILINNIAWCLRNFPIFGQFGSGDYLVQPIYVDDLAEFAIQARDKEEDKVVNVAGPDTYTFDQLVHLIKSKVRSNSKILHPPPFIPLIFAKIISQFVQDVLLTKDEMKGLMENLLYAETGLKGETQFSTWLEENKEFLGIQYASELKRHYL
ncbi:MAG: NAD-dependent epimerase/dehydratase [candidate division Zixibacteria bacterium RBG-1]|nr:MAG: NAD-dependent epimerase/dehydratase [candidate division Zixibacteria bacterium RBG-1]